MAVASEPGHPAECCVDEEQSPCAQRTRIPSSLLSPPEESPPDGPVVSDGRYLAGGRRAGGTGAGEVARAPLRDRAKDDLTAMVARTVSA